MKIASDYFGVTRIWFCNVHFFLIGLKCLSIFHISDMMADKSVITLFVRQKVFFNSDLLQEFDSFDVEPESIRAYPRARRIMIR